MATLTVRDLSFSFALRDGDRRPVLENVDFEIADGEFVSVVGPSGSGKTTLLRVIDGLLPHTDGEVMIDGRLVSGPGAERAVVFQSDSLFPWRTVENNTSFGLQIMGVGKKERSKVAREKLNLVGLEGFEEAYPTELSGGMRQRVNLARALAVDPGVLLMDEPFGALDAQTREYMQRELLRIWEKQTKTVLFITHGLDEAVYLADRVVVLGGTPAGIVDILNIELPRPRELSIKRSVEFNRYVDRLWDLLGGEPGPD